MPLLLRTNTDRAHLDADQALNRVADSVEEAAQ